MQNCTETHFGRFELVRELTRGLNSTVYLSRDPEIERTVIIKLFGKGLLAPDELAERVRSVNQLSHVGIAKIFDLGYTEPAGDPFLVMEFVEGKPLESMLERGKLPETEALGLTLDLLSALSCAHAHGVLHHNLKPSNLVVTRDGHLKVTDFVASRRTGATPFTAPERLKGNGDERSDLFSVGVILYLMLSGFRPFQGNTEATIGFKLVHQHPVPVAAMDLELSPELDFVIGRFLAKNPDERYQTAEEAIRDVAQIRSLKAAGEPASQNEPVGESTLNLLETMGYRAGEPRASENGHSRRVRDARVISRFAIPVGIAVASLVALMAARSYMPRVPSAPALSVHLNVPSIAMESHEAASRTVKVKARSSRAAKKSSSESAPPKSTVSPNLPPQPKPGIVAVPVELRQPFSECVLSIWVDEKLAYTNRIRAEKKSRFLHMGSSTAEYLTLVEIPEGDHSVKVEVNGIGENYDASASLSATFVRTSDHKLRVTAEKSHPQLDLQLN
ncbi:MAG TPA: serine/threonine-protein kinase [Terriglobales bacterium]|nr:serine/threonine-protein kinase [Terriglobales bacterium]